MVRAGTVGDGVHFIQGDRLSGSPAAGISVRPSGLYTNGLDLGSQALDGGSNAGNKSAAANGDRHSVQSGLVLDDLQSNGALSGGHIGVGIGMDVHHALLLHQLGSSSLPLGAQSAHQLHLAAESLDTGQLDRVGIGRHNDDRPGS